MSIPSLPVIRPVARVCAEPKCRRRAMLTAPDLFATIVPNQGGGTRKEAGYECPTCARQNDVPAALLPKGLVPLLPLHAAWLATRQVAAPAAVAAAKPVVEVPKPAPPVAKPVRAQAKPVWTTGTAARQLLETGLAAAGTGNGAVLGLWRRDGQLSSLPIDPGVARGSVADLLAYLDESDCELLVIDGSAGKTILHPRAGATSFVA